MRENLKTYPTDGKWMSAYRWKKAFEKELREKTFVAGEESIYTLIKEILGE